MATRHAHVRPCRQGTPFPIRTGIRHWCLSIVSALLVLTVPLVAWADKAKDVAALEAKCAQEREAKIKPLREAQIAKCKADPANDPEHCEHFFSELRQRRSPHTAPVQ
jgi:hypothetical protein